MSAPTEQGPAKTTILRARWVLAHRDDDHRLLTDGEVRVEGDRIAAYGGRGELGEADEVIDLGDAVLMPGFVDLDALGDIDHAVLDSWHSPEHAALLQWSERHATSDHDHVLDETERASMRRFAFAQLLLHGVTTAMPIASEVHGEWAETFGDAVAMAEEADRLGLRVYLGPSYRSGVPVRTASGDVEVHWNEAKGEEGFADAVRFLDWVEAERSPLVRGALLPCRIETMTEELLTRTAEVGRERDVPVRLHALQGVGELRMLRERGTTPVDLMERTGLLNDRLLVPHGIYTDENPAAQPGGGSVSALADAGVAVIHCPLTSAHYGAALRSFDAYRAAGVRIALGTDSFPPDMFRGMDMGSSIAKILAGRLDAGAHADYVRAATVGGADALRRPDLGRIEPGAQADLIAIRLDDQRDGVIDDPIRSMIQHTTARAVDLTMVAGVVRVREGAIVGTDMTALRAEAQRLFRKLRSGYAARTEVPVSEDALFPGAFPSV